MSKMTLLALVLLATGCQWVKPTNAGEQVSLVKTAHVANCKKLGNTISSVKGKVGFIERKERKVADELAILAKNEAANMGGDTIVAIGQVGKGQAEGSRQEFHIYKCQ